MEQKPPLMLLPMRFSKKISRYIKSLNNAIVKSAPNLEKELIEAEIKMNAEEYIGVSLVNSMLFFFLFFILLFILNYKVKESALSIAMLTGFAYALGIFALFFIVLFRYPSILAGKKAEEIDKNLVFALKDIMMQVNAGVPLYNALANVSKRDYGIISKEFEKVVQNVSTGESLERALEKMALTTKSMFLRKTTWQLINTLKAGASLRVAIKTIITNLTADQKTKIKNYAQELNLWSLVYMLFAVAVPTIGATMLIILSSFAGAGMGKGVFIIFIVICFLIQIALIGFIKSRRPMVVA